MPKKTIQPDPRELARAIVTKRLTPVDQDWHQFIAPAGVDSPDDDWYELLEAIGASEDLLPSGYNGEWGRVSTALDPFDLENVFGSIVHAATQAGFLVGVELGRRLGGAR